MSTEGLQVVRDHHLAGEYSFTPSELTLSIVPEVVPINPAIININTTSYLPFPK